MQPGKLRIAIDEAERFIRLAKKAQTRQDKDWKIDSVRLGLTMRERYGNISKENATCKRASLDLTRALSELRKS